MAIPSKVLARKGKTTTTESATKITENKPQVIALPDQISTQTRATKMEEDTKKKLADGAMVAAKITGMMGANFLAAGIGGRMHGAIIPRPINMWKNQRRSRAFQNAFEEIGISPEFKVKVTFGSKEPKISSLTWASWNIGCDKWELAYYLAKDGSCSFSDGKIVAELVES